jgi:hypothetical protein
VVRTTARTAPVADGRVAIGIELGVITRRDYPKEPDDRTAG